MPVTLRIAFRNLFEHKSKSIIIGILLALGAFVLVLGNSFIDASRQGIRTAFTDNYTGDVFVSGISAEGEVSLFGVTSVGGLAATPQIAVFEDVLSVIKASPPRRKGHRHGDELRHRHQGRGTDPLRRRG